MKTYQQVKQDLLSDIDPRNISLTECLSQKKNFAIRSKTQPGIEYIFRIVTQVPCARGLACVYALDIPSAPSELYRHNIWIRWLLDAYIPADFEDFCFCDKNLEEWRGHITAPFEFPWIQGEEKQSHLEKLKKILQQYDFPDVAVVPRILNALSKQYDNHKKAINGNNVTITELIIKKDNSGLGLKFIHDGQYYHFSLSKVEKLQYSPDAYAVKTFDWDHSLEIDFMRRGGGYDHLYR